MFSILGDFSPHVSALKTVLTLPKYVKIVSRCSLCLSPLFTTSIDLLPGTINNLLAESAYTLRQTAVQLYPCCCIESHRPQPTALRIFSHCLFFLRHYCRAHFFNSLSTQITATLVDYGCRGRAERSTYLVRTYVRAYMHTYVSVLPHRY